MSTFARSVLFEHHLHKPSCSMHQYALMFSPFYDASHCWNFTNSNYACLDIPRLIIVCCAAVLCCVLWFVYFSTFFFLVVVHTNIASITTNILITNIIILIPEGNYLTCMPPTSCASSQILLSSRAQKAKTFSLAHSGWRAREYLAPGARPPFKICTTVRRKVECFQPGPLPPPSHSTALFWAALTLSFLQHHCPLVPHPPTLCLSLCYLHYLSKSCRFCSAQGHHSKLLLAMF